MISLNLFTLKCKYLIFIRLNTLFHTRYTTKCDNFHTFQTRFLSFGLDFMPIGKWILKIGKKKQCHWLFDLDCQLARLHWLYSNEASP